MNPFNKTTENDKAQLWETLVERDSLAFVNQDWSLVKDDFVSDNFMGIHANFESNPDLWKISFPDLKSYREEWLKDAKEFCDENCESLIFLKSQILFQNYLFWELSPTFPRIQR